jgi:hypothetical protein
MNKKNKYLYPLLFCPFSARLKIFVFFSLALGRLRQENCKLQASLGYEGRPYLKKTKTTKLCIILKYL